MRRLHTTIGLALALSFTTACDVEIDLDQLEDELALLAEQLDDHAGDGEAPPPRDGPTERDEPPAPPDGDDPGMDAPDEDQPCDAFLVLYEQTQDPALLDHFAACTGDPCDELLVLFEATGDESLLDAHAQCIGDAPVPCEAHEIMGDDGEVEIVEWCDQPTEDPCDEYLLMFERTQDPAFLDHHAACTGDPCDELLILFEMTGDESLLEAHAQCVGDSPCTVYEVMGPDGAVEVVEDCGEPGQDPCDEFLLMFEQTQDPAFLEQHAQCTGDPCDELLILFELTGDEALLEAHADCVSDDVPPAPCDDEGEGDEGMGGPGQSGGPDEPQM